MTNLYKAWGKLELALTAYEKVVALRPGHASGHIYAGAVLAQLGRFEAALVCHQSGAHCLEGHVEEAHYNLGLVFRAQERFDDAKLSFERALELNPTYHEARVALADVVSAQSIDGEARAKFR